MAGRASVADRARGEATSHRTPGRRRLTDPSWQRRVRPLLRPRTASLLIVVAVVVLNLLQQPGLITFDTKLDLQFDPAGFLTRSLELWNPDSTVGGLQNQASGYLFPMGPAFWLGTLLGVPMWVWERLWSAAVMLLAYEGARRLALRWPGIGTWGAVVAGLAFMLAPRVLLTVGGLSGETLPTAVLPWTVLPLVLYLRGRLRRSLAFVWSAATVVVMGGQNATLVFACLLFPALLLALVTGRTIARRLTDVAGWGALTVLASLWWVGPLLLLGGYAPPFLDFIESSHNTAGNVGWLTSLRGTGHWVAFFPGGGSAGWAGGYDIVSSAVLLVTTVAVAAAGLVGLALPGLWARRALLTVTVVGLAVLTLGAGGWAGSVLAEPWLTALDGPLAPLRNIHKFDPLVRLPLCLGVGAFVSVGLPRLVAAARTWTPLRARRVRAAGTAAVVAAVLAAAQPALSGDLRVSGGMDDISTPWRSAATYLAAQPSPARVIVLPGSGFAVQDWGRTLDEPIQVLDTPPWLARAQVTVAPAATLRVLDSLESQVDQGRPGAGLADSLRRLGITHVVVRNDLDRESTDAPSPDVVHAALAGAEDLAPVAAFGRRDGRAAVEIYELSGTGPEPRVRTARWAERRVVQGGPEVVDDLVSAGLVAPGQPTVLAGAGESTDILTDSNRRVERSFGRVHDATSAVMTEEERYRLPRPVHDYVGGDVPAEVTTAEYAGAELVTASSSQGFADIIGPVRPARAPYAAFDRSGLTAWESAPFSDPVGQWIEARFEKPRTLRTLGLWFDVASGARVTSVRVRTDNGSVTASVDGEGRATGVRLPEGATSRLRITVTGVADGARRVRLINVDLGGHQIRRSFRLPGVAGPQASVYLAAETGRRACVGTGADLSCDRLRDTETPETAGFDRTVEVGAPTSWRLSGRVVATHGSPLDELLAPISPRQVRALASSTFGGDPAVAAANAVDGRDDTGWYASPLDSTPALVLSWQGKETVRGLQARLAAGQPGELPSLLVVDPMVDGEQPQLVATAGPDAGRMTPVRTNRLRISVLAGTELEDGLGISELEVEGLRARTHTPDPAASTGLVCGFGPEIKVGGRTVQTRVTGTLGDVVSGGELTLEPCGDDVLPVADGSTRIRVTNPAGFAVSRLWLEPADRGPRASARRADEPEARVLRWTATERTVQVTARDEAVLSLPQSVNPGWEATLDGERLDDVVVDGWKQGWLVPAGSAGEVDLRFAPQRAFEVSVAGGLAIAGLLGLLAVVTLGLARRRPSWAAPTPRPDVDPPAPTGWLRGAGLAAAALALALVSAPLAAGAVAGYWARRRTTIVNVALAAAGALLAAAVATVLAESVVVPPTLANVLAALAVGSVAGAVLKHPESRVAEPPEEERR